MRHKKASAIARFISPRRKKFGMFKNHKKITEALYILYAYVSKVTKFLRETTDVI